MGRRGCGHRLPRGTPGPVKTGGSPDCNSFLFAVDRTLATPILALVTTPASDDLMTARKRVISAALNQRNPSPELVKALNRYLTLARHELAPKEDK